MWQCFLFIHFSVLRIKNKFFMWQFLGFLVTTLPGPPSWAFSTAVTQNGHFKVKKKNYVHKPGWTADVPLLICTTKAALWAVFRWALEWAMHFSAMYIDHTISTLFKQSGNSHKVNSQKYYTLASVSQLIVIHFVFLTYQVLSCIKYLLWFVTTAQGFKRRCFSTLTLTLTLTCYL